jgi:hypothetical protein
VVARLSEGVIDLFEARDRTDAADWLRLAVADARRFALRIRFAQAQRSLGCDRLELGSDECRDNGLPERLADIPWRTCDLARIALVLAELARIPTAEHVETVATLWRRGELGERESLLRGLSLLPGPERFTALARAACRTHEVCTFEAIACENPFPSEQLDDPAFRQLVLKAVVLGLPVRRIVGLERRADGELRRMAAAYMAERRAAGRSVPVDIDLLITDPKAAPPCTCSIPTFT